MSNSTETRDDNAHLDASSIQRPSLALLGAEPFRAAMESACHKLGKTGDAKPGDGHPVVIFPGLSAHGGAVAPLRDHCRSLGYDAFDWGQGFNTEPHQRRLALPLAERQFVVDGAGAEPAPAHTSTDHQQGKCMNKPLGLIALCASVLWLSACGEKPTPPPTPMVNKPVAIESGATAATVTDPSVPSAASVLPPANAAKADQTPGRSNSSMSVAQESTAMPMPGQNNDHSAPLGPPKRASSP